jgi:transposase-like protein
MARRCTICDNAARAAIEASLIGGEPESVERVAKRFGVSKWALGRHRRNHMEPPSSLAQVTAQTDLEALEDLESLSVEEQVRALIRGCHRLLERAENQGTHVATQTKVYAELRKQLELLARLVDKLPPSEVQIIQVITGASEASQTEPWPGSVLEGPGEV